MFIEFKECPILHTHRDGGAVQGRSTMVKDNTLYWLSGYKSINVPSQVFPNCSTGKEMYFKKGWYNDKLEYAGEITQEDHDYIAEWVSVF